MHAHSIWPWGCIVKVGIRKTGQARKIYSQISDWFGPRLNWSTTNTPPANRYMSHYYYYLYNHHHHHYYCYHHYHYYYNYFYHHYCYYYHHHHTIATTTTTTTLLLLLHLLLLILTTLLPEILVSVPRMPFPETMTFQIGGFFVCKKTSTELVIMKCCKALWLHVHKALWSNCKQIQSSKSIFSLWKKYELLLQLQLLLQLTTTSTLLL